MKKKIIISTLVVAVLLVGTYVVSRRSSSVQTIPTLSPRNGNAGPSAEFLNAQKAVDYYRDEIAKHPDAVKNYIELAQLFLQEARVTGNHHEYLPKADYLLDEVLKRDPVNSEATITKGSMQMTMHRFRNAKELALKVIGKNPYNAFAYGVLCDAQVELGEYEDAVQTCDKMLSRRPDLRSYARASYIRELHGDFPGAVEAMKMAADAGVFGQESRVWALYNLGKLFLNQGKLDTAAYIFNGILEERPNYAYALSGLAMVKQAKGETQAAVELLSKAAQLTPEHVFVEQLADVYRASGDVKSANGVAQIALKAFAQHEKAGWNIDREYAMFCANHEINLPDALERAKRDYDSRPNNIDALETYAWVLHKNGRTTNALPYIERAMQLGTKNALMHHRASIILAAAGEHEKAVNLRQQALAENGFVDVLATERAPVIMTTTHASIPQ
ncbi:MAG: tetratricopeptide repeat protein [Ignavibacteriae bacterium]|nr:tetratricopeptide repeat protein [Ignavibacteria bacterium]MBI3364036.1 tetratricopeptide repeat protein [Ignavibacteriota bacterium]